MKRLVVLMLAVLLYRSGDAQHRASVRETVKPYSTYPFSDPDPVPNAGKIYPYFRYDGFSQKPVMKRWKVVILENDYIRVQIMPEIGGKIWNAYDKKNKRYFIYNNDVVKFRDIAMRGPWTSGGLEANFGIIGHTPAVATPVDYVTRENADGSASCFIGTLDLLTRSRWTVEINLPQDKGCFITRVFWHNAGNIERPYYSWMNLAVKTEDSLEFIDPGSHYIGHDGRASEWPFDSARGVDLSMYGRNNFGADKSYHIFGSAGPFYGAYWKKEDYGMIHFARREDKPGKKVFLWALSDEGKIWEQLLTDTNGQYAEIQSGRLFNQNMPTSSQTPFRQMTFMPYQTDTWEEYWYPFSKTGGISHADRNAVIYYSETGDSLQIAVSAVSRIEGELTLFDSAGKTLAARHISMAPLTQQRFAFGEEVKQFSRMIIGDDVIGRHDDDADLNRPVARPDSFNQQSAYALYLKGRDEARFGMLDSAEADLHAALATERGLMPALSEMSLLKYRRMQYDSAVMFAKEALQVDTYDPQSNYAYAIASEKAGNPHDALDGFQIASMNAAYRGPALTAISRYYLRDAQPVLAQHYASEALRYDRDNVTALELSFVCARLLNSTPVMDSARTRILGLDPLNHFVAFEKYWSAKDSASRKEFTAGIRTELTSQTYLELAIWYHSIGRDEEARELLVIAPAENEIAYWRAYLASDSAAQSAFLKAADAGSAAMVFPFRSESAEVMDWAMRHSNDWKPRYYLALIALAQKNNNIAAGLLNREDPAIRFAPYYVLRARMLSSADSNTAVSNLRKAVSVAPEEWRYRKLLSEYYLTHHRADSAASTLEQFYRRHPSNYIIGSLYARSLMAAGDYAKAESILDTIHILPFEGARDGRKLFREDKLMLALNAIRNRRFDVARKKIAEAREWPVRLGAGKPYPSLVDTRLEDQLAVLLENVRHDAHAQVDFSSYEKKIRDKDVGN